MPEAHHKSEAQQSCDASGCKEPAERSLSAKKVEAAGISLGDAAGKSAHLCRKHYREFKKKTKKDRDLERLGW